ncbi:MAG: glycosyltransferase [Clostridiales bacterium]|nr:glycosyltransferase [Clostridiales bacterium]
MRFSVIIPVYNAEKTLRRCVDSVLGQESADIEIILVNDGSTDGSGSICEEYSRMAPSVRYISQKNGGVSAARNAGLDAAQGEYILFVDSDDHLPEGFGHELERIAAGDCADFIRFSDCVFNGSESKRNICRPFFAGTRKEILPRISEAICMKTINPPWAKLYKRGIIEKHGIRFPVGASVGEDRAFNIVYSLYIDSYAESETVGYVLNTENENSLSRKRHDDLKKQFAVAGEYIQRELAKAPIPENEKDSYRRAIDFGTCRGVYHDAKLMIQDKTGWFARQRELLQLCRKINGKHMKYPKTRYCTMITLPVRLCLTPVIDAVAGKLTRGAGD